MFQVQAQSEDINVDATEDVVSILGDYFPEGLGDSPTDEAIKSGKARTIYRRDTSEMSLIAC